MRIVLDRILEKFLVLIMALLVIDVLWQVFSRYVLNTPSSFTDELAGFLLIWVGLFGGAYVAGKNEHLAIDLLLQKSNPKRRRIIELIINLIIFLFAVLVMVVGGSWLVYSRFLLAVRSAALELPLGYVYIVLPISGLLIAYYMYDNTFRILKNQTEK